MSEVIEMKQAEDKTKQPLFEILKIYTKDVSFEMPSTLQVSEDNLESKVDLDLNVVANQPGEDIHEIILKTTVTSKMQDKIIFLIEVSQVGLFHIKDFSEGEVQELLGSFCPTILFPYIREVVSNLTVHASFPPLYLTPVNFEAMYQKHLEEEAGKQK